MSNPPGSFRWAPHFEDHEVEELSRLAFNGLKDATDAIKMLSGKHNVTAAQTAQLSTAVVALQAQVTQLTETVNNITNTTNITNLLGIGGVIDCGTYSGY
jgi:hypothetical protein